MIFYAQMREPFFNFKIAAGLKVYIQHFLKPDFLFRMKKEFSNGDLSTQENSILKTRKFCLVKEVSDDFAKIILERLGW